MFESKKFTYYFFCPDHGEKVEDADSSFESKWSPDSTDEIYLKWVAEDAAEYYHDNCDGWESSWPMEFTILDDKKKVLGTFIVERESVPQFSASKKKEPIKES